MSYYSTGGTIFYGAPSYVKRKADNELYRALKAAEFAYILNSRQIGKSSLTIQVANRLQESNIETALVSLNGIGHSEVTPEAFYFTLLMMIGEELNCDSKLEELWNASSFPTPLQKFFHVLQRHIRDSPAPIVIFLDEIDGVRSLSFDASDFFAAIRNCYNRRSINPEFNRLTFCLIGCSLPSDLIDNPLLTPFNVGNSIFLEDFTFEETSQLAQGLATTDNSEKGRSQSQALALLKRVYHWTNGHPYLTQQFCDALAKAPEIVSDSQVDRICHKLFLSPSARLSEMNLAFVRDRLLKSDNDTASLLDLYRRIYKIQQVGDLKATRLMDGLKLSEIGRAHV